MAKVLITGAAGYIGPVFVEHLQKLKGFDISGVDTCFYSNLLPIKGVQLYNNADIRNIGPDFLRGYTSVIHLAALSNDPIGNDFEALTHEINCKATFEVALLAKKAGVRNFVFASSCSVYGQVSDGLVATESTAVNPLTAYARSKVNAEKELKQLADHRFSVTCLRFATACGASPNMRLDLVLNDFVASAMSTGEITILSDGSPVRPLIDIHDMSRVLHWSTIRGGKPFLIMNAGRENYTVKEIAEAVAGVIPAKISINSNAAPDKRSYRVGFGLFKELAPDHQPLYDLAKSAKEIQKVLKKVDLTDFRNSDFIRLNRLRRLRAEGKLDENLNWK